MGYAPWEKVKALIESNLDQQRFNGLYSQKCELLGVPVSRRSKGTGVSTTADWPIFPDIDTDSIDVGIASRTLNVASIMTSRYLSSQIDVEFAGTRQIDAEVLKEYVRVRASNERGETGPDFAMAALDGIEFGIGGLEVGMEDGPSGLQRVAVRYHDNTQILVDHRFINPTRGLFIAFMDPLPVEEAEGRYGAKAIEGHTVTMASKNGGHKWEVVPVVTCYTRQTASYGPSRFVYVGGTGSKPIEDGENPFGDLLPGALSIGMVAPGGRYPIGALKRQLPIAEQLKRIDLYYRKRMEMPHVMYIDTQAGDDADVKAFIDRCRRDGNIFVIRKQMPPGQPVQFFPAPEISVSANVYKQDLERQWNEAADLSDLDRSMALEGNKTKFEAEQLVQRSQRNQGGAQWQTTELARRLVDLMLKIGGMYDREPFVASVFGSDVAINVPGRPESHIARFIDPTKQTLVGRTTLTPVDDRMKREARLRDIATVAQLGGAAVNPQMILEEAVKATGLSDEPEKWLNPAMGQPAQ